MHVVFRLVDPRSWASIAVIRPVNGYATFG